MTETPEEKDIIAAIERCIEGDLGPAYDLSNGLHMSPGETAVFRKWLNGAFQELEDKVTSLTKERDELKTIAENLKKDFKFKCGQLAEHMQERLKLANENANLKSQLSNREKEIEELKGNSEIFYIDPDDPYVEERSSLELAASMVGFNGGPVAELQVYAKKRLPNVFIIKRGCEHKAFTTKEEALASLNKSKEGEAQ